VKGNHIDIHQKIQFEVAKATIKQESYALLAEIADVIKKNPQIKKISIEGHSSAEGDAKMNQKLSEDRAASVRQHLIDKGGIKADALVSKGFGESKPLASNDTDEGKEKNRRVEFVIVDPPAAPGGTAAATPATPATPPTSAGALLKAPKAGKAK
jgi:outer membrane protein OmpA-like peptidoglycan-associated protein